MSAYPERGRLLAALWVVQSTAAAAFSWTGPQASGIAGALFWACVFGVCIALGAARGPSAGRSRAANALAVLGLAAFVLALAAGRTTSGLIGMLLWLLAGRNLVLGARREVHFLLLGSAAVLLFAAAEARSAWFLALLAAHTLAALLALSLCWAVRCRESMNTVALSAQPSRAAGLLAFSLAVLALAALWYLFVPRLPAAHVGVVPRHGGEDYSEDAWRNEKAGTARAEPGSPYNGLDDSLELRPGASPNARSNQIVMHVQADRPLYLRARTFDRFQDNRWSRADSAERRISRAGGGFSLSQAATAERSVEYVVNVAAELPARIYAQHRLVELAFHADRLAVDADGNLRLPAPLRYGARYTAKSAVSAARGRIAASGASPADPAAYLQLPSDTSEALRALAARVAAAGGADAMARAAAIEHHLRTEYAYDLDSAFSSQGVTPLDRFLFETRRGHCEYFASAMAVMLRSVGIPTRVASGFSAHAYNPITGFYEVRAFDAHAWVEAHIPPYGWVLFEPTPFYPLPLDAPQPATSAAQLERYLDVLAREEQMLNDAGVLTVIKTAWSEAGSYFVALTARLQDAADAVQRHVERHLAALLAWLAALALLGAAGFFLRVALARWAARSAIAWATRVRPQAAAIIAFGWACRLVALRGQRRAPGQTAEEYAAACLERWPQAAPGMRALITAFNDACYGGRRHAVADARAVLQAFDQIVITVLR